MARVAHESGMTEMTQLLSSWVEAPPASLPPGIGRFIGQYISSSVIGQGDLILDLQTVVGSDEIQLRSFRLDYSDYKRDNSKRGGQGDKVGRFFRASAVESSGHPIECIRVSQLLAAGAAGLQTFAINHWYKPTKDSEPTSPCVPLSVVIDRMGISSVAGFWCEGHTQVADGILLATFSATENATALR